MMEIHIMKVKDIEAYWKLLSKDSELLLRYLSDKHEYGSSDMCSEAGVQRNLIYYVENIAAATGAGKEKARAISSVIGLLYPQYGAYGIAAIKEYMMDKEIDQTLTDIFIFAAEKGLQECGSVISLELDKALHAYYENQTDDQEVNIVRYCQMKAREIRELMKSGVKSGEAVERIMEPAKDVYNPNESALYTEPSVTDIPEDLKTDVYNSIEEFVRYCGSIPEGIAEYIL